MLPLHNMLHKKRDREENREMGYEEFKERNKASKGFGNTCRIQYIEGNVAYVNIAFQGVREMDVNYLIQSVLNGKAWIKNVSAMRNWFNRR